MTKPHKLTPTEDLLVGIATALDEGLNGSTKAADRKVAFVVLLTNFDELEGGLVNYISNAQRDDIVLILRQLLTRFDARLQ